MARSALALCEQRRRYMRKPKVKPRVPTDTDTLCEEAMGALKAMAAALKQVDTPPPPEVVADAEEGSSDEAVAAVEAAKEAAATTQAETAATWDARGLQEAVLTPLLAKVLLEKTAPLCLDRAFPAHFHRISSAFPAHFPRCVTLGELRARATAMCRCATAMCHGCRVGARLISGICYARVTDPRAAHRCITHASAGRLCRRGRTATWSATCMNSCTLR